MKKTKGFTLIELTIVIFILSFMGLYIIPSLGDRMFDTDLKFKLRRMAGDINKIYNDAAMGKKAIYLSLDFSKNRYWVAQPDKDGNISEEFSKNGGIYMQFPENIVLLDVADGKEVYSKNIYSIIFTPRGLSDKYYIHILSKDTYYHTLSISPLTGQVEIKTGYVENSQSGVEKVSIFKKGKTIKRVRGKIAK